MIDIDRLEALAAAATPGPWWVECEGNGETCGSCRFLWRKSMGNFRGWKCELAALNADNDGPDMVKSWPACNWWEAPRNA